jgi:sugar lactone lactonase YvrE
MDECRVLVDGRGLVEAPRWHDGRLSFSDWTAGEVLVADADGHTEVVARVQSFPLCSAWAPDGRLLVVDAAEGRLLRREPDGSLQTYAELGASGWNDIVVDGRGNAYVNSVGFDMTAGEDPRPGHLVLVGADGAVRRVAEDLAFPNGMAVTGDNATLIVAESHGPRLTAFAIGDDGDLSGRRARSRPARPGRVRLRARRPRPPDPVRHRRPVAPRPARAGAGGQRPGLCRPGGRARGRLAVTGPSPWVR